MATGSYYLLRRPGEQTAHIVVGNVPGVQHSVLREILGLHGTVVSIASPPEGSSHVFASYAEAAEAAAAAAAMDGRPCPELGGRVLVVRPAGMRRPKVRGENILAEQAPGCCCDSLLPCLLLLLAVLSQGLCSRPLLSPARPRPTFPLPPAAAPTPGVHLPGCCAAPPQVSAEELLKRLVPAELHAEACGVPGLLLLLDFVTEEAEAALLALVDREPWIQLKHRRVQHYGAAFDYPQRLLDRVAACPPIPPVLRQLAGAIQALPGAAPLDQLTVNDYPCGAGISPHIDSHSAFGGPLAVVSLASPAAMVLRRAGVPSRALLLPPRSLLLMTGEARYRWEVSSFLSSSRRGVGVGVTGADAGECSAAAWPCRRRLFSARGSVPARLPLDCYPPHPLPHPGLPPAASWCSPPSSPPHPSAAALHPTPQVGPAGDRGGGAARRAAGIPDLPPGALRALHLPLPPLL